MKTNSSYIYIGNQSVEIYETTEGWFYHVDEDRTVIQRHCAPIGPFETKAAAEQAVRGVMVPIA